MDCLDRLPQVGGGRGRGMEDLVDDSTWREVLLINTYALFTGHLSMAIRGLGFLTITWTTVVLLGGFVSTLNKKDFWCLTVISLLQTAGVYDVFLTEKLGYINQSAKVFLAVPFSRPEDYDSRDRRIGCFIPQWCAGAVKTLVLSIVLCPLMALYMFGLLISTGISLWRLIEHDFGDEEAAHLKASALLVLYSLAVLQGSLFIYRFIFSRKEKDLVKQVAEGYQLDRDGEKLVRDYARELRIGCDKDPTFANGRNLITFAVDLIKSESPAKYISGVTILHRIACAGRDRGHLMLIKQLIGTTPSCTILQKLVQTLHEGSPYDVDTRIRAARIVEHFADHFYLEQFPRGTQCIISLLSQACSRMDFGAVPSKNDTSPRARAKENEILSSLHFRSNFLAEQGLLILHKLAADEDNCRVMSSTTHGLVSKIMAPVSLHGLHHDVWSSIAHTSLSLVARLMKNAAGEALRREISTNNAVISTIETVLKGECRECGQELPEIAVETLLYMPPATKGRFMKIVANMIVDDSQKDSLRKMACENLMGLCIQCTENGEFLQQLLEALTELMPKILKEIVPPYGSAGDVMQTSTEALSAPGTDVEKGRVWRDDAQHVYKKLSSQPYYLSLCVAIRDTLISAYPHLARQFDELAADICPGEFKSFACLVNEWQLAADTCPVEFKSFACLVNEWQQFVDEKKKKYGGHSTTV